MQREDKTRKIGPDLWFLLSGWGDLNSRPSVSQTAEPQTADLRKHPETASGLPFCLITGSRWYALFRDVSRPVRGLEEGATRRPPRRLPGQILPARLCSGRFVDDSQTAEAYSDRALSIGRGQTTSQPYIAAFTSSGVGAVSRLL